MPSDISTISLPQLVEALQSATGCSATQAENFIGAFSDLITATLSRRENVEVGGLGIFEIGEIDGLEHVHFQPDEYMQQQVNSPFSLFEETAVPDGLSDTDIAMANHLQPAPCQQLKVSNAESEEKTPSAGVRMAQPVADNSPAVSEVGTGETTACTTQTSVPVSPTVTEQRQNVTPAETSKAGASDEPTTNIPPLDPPGLTPIANTLAPHHQSPLKWAICLCLTLLVGIVLGYFAYAWINLDDVKTVNIAAQQVNVTPRPTTAHKLTPDTIAADSCKTDSISAQGVTSMATMKAPVRRLVTDTVRPGRFLTTIALRHYGNKKFWVYIYQANSTTVADPDCIAPGTVVLIPPADSLGIDASSPASLEKAQELAQQILSAKSK